MVGLPDDSFELLKTLVDEPDNTSFESALNNENISYYIDAYAKFRHDARTDIATLVELLFNKSVVPGWDISKFAKNTEKNVRYRA
jgi:hypothetical protein